LKILHLIFSEQVAGAEKHLLSLLPGLQQEGYDCELICVTPLKSKDKFTGYCEELNQRGVKATLITGNQYGFLGIAKRIGKYCKENNIRVVHSHLFKSDLLAVLTKELFAKNIFLISTKHGYEEKYLSSYPEHKGKIFYNAYYFISKYLCRNTNEQVTVSRIMSDVYFNLKLTPQPIKYIHHGIDIAVEDITVNAAQFRTGEPQLIIVGRVEKVKGHQYLFDAMPAVAREFPGVKLLVIGEGTEKDNLINKASVLGIKDNVSFLGFQQDPYGYMTHSDLIILPSMFESFGLVYIEAFALQLPVVGFDAPACNEIIVDNETGLLVPMYDSQALAEKILFLLRNPEERKRLAENAYKKYKEYYTTSRMIGETAAWYRSILKA
jgi:glycosyltransferase involved in cell wall biosynthesis